jgi:hypothetical protein
MLQLEPATDKTLPFFQKWSAVATPGQKSPAQSPAQAPQAAAPLPTTMEELNQAPQQVQDDLRKARLADENEISQLSNVEGFDPQALRDVLNWVGNKITTAQKEADLRYAQENTTTPPVAKTPAPPATPPPAAAPAPLVKPQARMDLRIPNLTAGQPVREPRYDEVALAGKG